MGRNELCLQIADDYGYAEIVRMLSMVKELLMATMEFTSYACRDVRGCKISFCSNVSEI